MKKFMIVLIALTVTLSGCLSDDSSITGSGKTTTTDYNFANFSKIESNNNFKVILEQSDEYSIEVICDDNIVEYLDIDRQGKTLSLSLESFKLYRNIEPIAKISMPDIEKIQGNGSSDIIINNEFSLNHDLEIGLSGASSLSGSIEAYDLDVELSGSSEIEAYLDIDDLKLILSGASRATLEGVANNLTTDISGSSQVYLYDLPINDADVKLSGASDAKINAKGFVSLDASGASTLTYKGTAKIEDIELSGSSKIKKAD